MLWRLFLFCCAVFPLNFLIASETRILTKEFEFYLEELVNQKQIIADDLEFMQKSIDLVKRQMKNPLKEEVFRDFTREIHYLGLEGFIQKAFRLDLEGLSDWLIVKIKAVRILDEKEMQNQSQTRKIHLIEDIFTGASSTCVIDAKTGFLKCWGFKIAGADEKINKFAPFSMIGGKNRTLCVKEKNESKKTRCWQDFPHFTKIFQEFDFEVDILAPGSDHVCVVRKDTNKVECKGKNFHHQIDTPIDLGEVVAISAGSHHTCAIKKETQEIKCWGDDDFRQKRVLPTIKKAKAIAAGYYHTCAIKEVDSHVSCWGEHGDGQTSVPADLGEAVAISAGAFHSCAIKKENRKVYCWGNGISQSNIVGAEIISSGTSHNCAVLENGSISCWGGQNGESAVPAEYSYFSL